MSQDVLREQSRGIEEVRLGVVQGSNAPVPAATQAEVDGTQGPGTAAVRAGTKSSGWAKVAIPRELWGRAVTSVVSLINVSNSVR